jgi:hypothetical protein
MTDDDDPEVLADLRLRASSQRDKSRDRGDGDYSWTPPNIVGKWRCRNPRCGELVDVPEVAMDRFCAFNAELRRRGEEPLDRDRILFCPRCTDEFKRVAGDRARDRVERMRSAIIELKQTRDPERQRELLDQLRVWHHPDVDGLTLWLRERERIAGNAKPKRQL